MRPRKTPQSNAVYMLPGGNEDNDLHVEKGVGPEGQPYLVSEWEFTPAEREAVAVGGRVQLIIHSHMLPPVSMVTVLRTSTGDLYAVEPDEASKGTAVLLPAQAERLRGWLRESKEILVRQLEDERDAETPNQAAINNLVSTIAGFDDLLHDLRPVEQRELP